jgi:hypothetical protein
MSNVTLKIAFSRENPQYVHELIHSLDKYSGANIRTAFPKLRRVNSAASRAISSKRASPTGASSEVKRRRSGEAVVGSAFQKLMRSPELKILPYLS